VYTNSDFDFDNLKNAGLEPEKIKEKDIILAIPNQLTLAQRYRFQVVDDSPIFRNLQSKEANKDNLRDFLQNLIFVVCAPNKNELLSLLVKEVCDNSHKPAIDVTHTLKNLFEQLINHVSDIPQFTFSHEFFYSDFHSLDRNAFGLWQVPGKNTQFIGRAEILTEIKEQFDIQNNPTSIIALCGLGGVGKTEIALNFVLENQDAYRGVCWFRVDSKQSLRQQYVKLGHALNLVSKDASNEEYIVSAVKNWFAQPKNAGWLLVYDHVSSYEAISQFQPALDSTDGKTKILITSRKKEHYFPMILVNEFTPDESEEYIKTHLKQLKNQTEFEGLRELANTLENFPLALASACEYMNETEISPDCYRNYLTQEEYRKYLLSESRYAHETFWPSWPQNKFA